MPPARWSIALVCAACFSESSDDALAGSSSDETTSSSSTSARGESSGSSATADAEATTASPGSTSGETSDTQQGDGTIAGDCGAQTAVPPFAAPWSGPIVVLHAAPMAPPPMCPIGFAPAGDPVIAAEGTDACACNCVEPPWERCNVTIRPGNNLNCDNGAFQMDEACEVPAPDVTAAGLTISADTCTTMAVAVPATGGATAMCTPMEGDGTCIDVPLDVEGPCIFAEDVDTCPAEYPNALPSKRVSCSACTGCTDLAAYCNALHLGLYAADDCSGAPVNTANNGGCSTTPGNPDAAIGSVALIETTPYTCSTSVESHLDVSICCV